MRSRRREGRTERESRAYLSLTRGGPKIGMESEVERLEELGFGSLYSSLRRGSEGEDGGRGREEGGGGRWEVSERELIQLELSFSRTQIRLYFLQQRKTSLLDR